MTRYVVLGAGAVGSALGGLLAHEQVDVLLVGRGEHAARMAAYGLTVRCPATTLTLPVPVVTAPGQAHLTVDDVLVLATKTQHAEADVGEWADVPVHDHDGSVAGRAADLLPMRVAPNGVTGERIALRYVERVYGVCVWFPAVMVDPGEVIVRGTPQRGVFHVGRDGASPDPAADARLLDALSRDWEPAGCLVRRPDAVMEWKYRTLLANLGNVLEALLDDASGAKDVRRAAVAEARAVLDAAGIAVTGADESRAGWQPDGLSFASVPDEPPGLGSSTWQSLARGSGTIETDFLNGEIARIGRMVGQPAPVHARLTALARRAAAHRARPGSLDPGELRRALSLT